jgi:hypothetical protein
MPNLNRTEANLTNLGLAALLKTMLLNQLQTPWELNFSQPTTAKTAQRLLYNWLTFHPEIKCKVSLKLDKAGTVLTVIPKGVPEGRGRKRF